MPTPLVSVCVMTYNHAGFIREALVSAAEQDYGALEVVVADDGSTDGTYDAAREVAAEYRDRIVLLEPRRNEGLRGIGINGNRALAACRGDYLVLLQGDDVFLPGKIAAQVAWLEEDPRRVLCGHDVDVFDSDSGESLFRWRDVFALASGEGAASVVRDNVPFGTVSIMVRRSAAPKTGFDQRLLVVLDWMFWIECLSGGGRYGFVDGVLARYRRHAGGVTRGFDQIRLDDQMTTLALVEARHPALAGACREGRSRIRYAIGAHHLFRDRMDEARPWLAEAARGRDRYAWRARAALLLTRLPAPARHRLVDWWSPAARNAAALERT